MILIGTYLDKPYFKPFTYFYAGILEGLLSGLIQHFSTVFHGADKVIQEQADIVGLVDMFIGFHVFILPCHSIFRSSGQSPEVSYE